MPDQPGDPRPEDGNETGGQSPGGEAGRRPFEEPPTGSFGSPPPSSQPSGASGQVPPPPPPPPSDYGQQVPPPPAGYSPGYPAAPQPTSSNNAVVSLVTGIISFFVCPIILGIVAVVYGNKARDEIESSGGMITGGGMATAGRIMGWINIILYSLLAFFIVFFSITAALA